MLFLGPINTTNIANAGTFTSSTINISGPIYTDSISSCGAITGRLLVVAGDVSLTSITLNGVTALLSLRSVTGQITLDIMSIVQDLEVKI